MLHSVVAQYRLYTGPNIPGSQHHQELQPPGVLAPRVIPKNGLFVQMREILTKSVRGHRSADSDADIVGSVAVPGSGLFWP